MKGSVNLKKERLFYLDFIRALAIISIVVYHFNVLYKRHGISGYDIAFEKHANGDLGTIGVSLFFLISGAALMYTYDKSLRIKEYFSRRFLSIYPTFWTAYSIFFLYFFYRNRSIDHSTPNWSIIFSFIGIDGYIGYFYNIEVFYFVGEWFLGCIIILYLIFPLIRKAMLFSPLGFFILSACFYLFFVMFYSSPIPIERHFLARIFDLILGMYFIKYIKRVNIYLAGVSIMVSLALLMIPISINKMYSITALGISVMVVLVFVAQQITNEKVIRIFELISKYSFSIFLVQHLLLDLVLNRFDGMALTRYETYSLHIIIWAVIMLMAVLVHKVSSRATKFLLSK